MIIPIYLRVDISFSAISTYENYNYKNYKHNNYNTIQYPNSHPKISDLIRLPKHTHSLTHSLNYTIQILQIQKYQKTTYLPTFHHSIIPSPHLLTHLLILKFLQNRNRYPNQASKQPPRIRKSKTHHTSHIPHLRSSDSQKKKN